MKTWKPEGVYDYLYELRLKRRIGKAIAHMDGGYYVMTCGHRKKMDTSFTRKRKINPQK